MRIVASNPDTIGDLVLRQPLYEALARAGHELLLIVRASAAPLVNYVAPGARITVLPMEVYRDDLALHWGDFAKVFADALEFMPDALLIAPYRWTQFEEKLAEELAGVRRFGMSGQLYDGDPHAGPAPVSRLQLDAIAQVQPQQLEICKNAALAELLGVPVRQCDPHLCADDASLQKAREQLRELGLEPRGFWIAGVAGTAHVKLKQWGIDSWGKALSHWSEKYGKQFLLVGLPQEQPIISAVMGAMGPHSNRCATWTGSGDELPVLLGLISLANGYAGHDSGPMHIAAAMGKPVVAVFGGGTWPRFVPAVEPSCAITVGVPCAGCGWACAFQQAHCITSVPLEQVIAIIDQMEAGEIRGRQLRVLSPPDQLTARMIRESAHAVRDEARQKGGLLRHVTDMRAEHQRNVDRQFQEAKAAQEQLSRELRGEFDARLESLRADLQKQQDAQLQQADALANILRQLEGRIAALEPKPKPPKLPWKIRAAKWLCGPEFYVPWRGTRKLPRISIITPVKNGKDWIAQTIESVLSQNYPDLEYIIVDGGSTDGTLDVIEAYRERLTKIISEPDEGMYDAIGKGFELASGDVLAYLNADDLYEPGGLLRVGEYFRDHPRTAVIYHEDTVTMGGWRFANRRQPHVDVYKLLAGHTLFQDGVFFRRSAFKLAGGIDRGLRRAGDWELWLRLARMFGMRRAPGHVSSFRIRPGQISEDRAAYEAERQEARQRFLEKFGMPGRIRCRVIQGFNWVRNATEKLLARRRFFWPIDYCGKPYPPGQPPQTQVTDSSGGTASSPSPGIPGEGKGGGLPGSARESPLSSHSLLEPEPQSRRPECREKEKAQGCAPPVIPYPLCPLTGRAPDRLLFSTQDTRCGDRRIHYVYFESETGMAMAFPPMSHEQLNELYERHYSQPLTKVIEPDPAYHSPYKNFRGGNIIARNLSRIPSPWWWFFKVRYHDDAAAEIIRGSRGFAGADDQQVRFLDVGCFEGDLLDQLRQRTKWKLFGLEANQKAVQTARGKGHQVWQAAAEDAPFVVPESQSFDLIFLGQTLEHLDDPLAALNRLRPLLAPRGTILVSLPNLDSKQVELFGPTWAHWHMPYHRTLLTRRALRRMARLAGLRVQRLYTRTHPYWTTMSVQLNRLGLGAVVPHSAYFPNEMSMHGVRLTGWCRLLWDWRGKGDYMFAVLRENR